MVTRSRIVFGLLVQTSIFKRDGRLAGEKFEYFDAIAGKSTDGYVIFQVQNPDESSLTAHRHTEHGFGLVGNQIAIARKSIDRA